MPAASQPKWYLYVVRAGDGTLYTGIATDVARRLAEHDSTRRGARYLRGRGPLQLVFRRRIGDRGLAMRAEHGVKRLSRVEKEALIAVDPDRRKLLRMLAL
jgi:predicted GIY-YIG superfamily endonuclease